MQETILLNSLFKSPFMNAFLNTKPPIECATMMIGTWPSRISPASWYFIRNSKSAAKSPIVKDVFSFLDWKSAFYPNVRILAVGISCGSQSRGHRKSRFLSLHHVRKLDPPRPWINRISTERPGGEWRTVRPNGSSLTSRDGRLFLVAKLSFEEGLPPLSDA